MDSNYKIDGSGRFQGMAARVLVFFSYVLFVILIPFHLLTWWGFLAIIKEYERVVVFRLGTLRKGGALGPGVVFLLPFADTYRIVDLRTKTFDLWRQKILSKDSVTVFVDAVVVYSIQNAVAMVLKVQQGTLSTELLAVSILRNVLGTKMLSEIINERQHLSELVKSKMEEATSEWGIKVEQVAIKDAKLPRNLQRVMAAEAEATRKAKARVIEAEGERDAARKLTEAGQVIDKTPMAMELRMLDTFRNVSISNNHTIAVPIPMELLKKWP